MRPGRKRLLDQHASQLPPPARETKPKSDKLNPSYASGPAVHMHSDQSETPRRIDEQAKDQPSVSLRSPDALRHETTVTGNGRTIRLQGVTRSQYDGSTSQIRNQRVTAASGCENCDQGCMRVRGTLVIRYRVTTTVTLPSVNDYPDLTPCQQRRVQDAIDNILAPHEQEHVRAFETYNGTTEHPFDLRVCDAEEANQQLQAIHDGEAASREATAQAASDALDPFHFDVDLDCEDESSEGGDEPGAGATPPAASPGPVAPENGQSEMEAEAQPAAIPETEADNETAEEQTP